MNSLVHPAVRDGWFYEISESMWPGQALALRVNQILHVEKSKYQDILVFESTDYGNVLVLDGVVQVTERDEFSYQEMITHLAMMSHPDPRRVLVVGGGDGGVLREVVKHPSVDSVTLVEIDEQVVNASKKFLPSLAVGFQHPKVHLHIGDGISFLQSCAAEFDVIITDSSDPEGPAESLFGSEYFKLLHAALSDTGVIITQGECMWLHLPLIKKVVRTCAEFFPNVRYAYTTIPTYPSGQIGFVLASKNADPNFSLSQPLRRWTEAEELEKCRYYNARVHEAAFVLPNFARDALSR